MPHESYHEIKADTPFELGLKKGELFGKSLRKSLKDVTGRRSWRRRVDRARPYLDASEEYFPRLIDEFKGHAKGADVAFEDLWAWDLDDELEAERRDRRDRCTTIVTNNGFLLGHNEDWDEDAADDVCVLRRTVGEETAFELYYLHTLGGVAAGVNSHGVAHAVNTLVHTDHQVGVPKNVVARWLSDTDSPERACQAAGKLTRASGYHHTLVDALGNVCSLECSAKQYQFTKVETPFVHCNHFVCKGLASLEGSDDRGGTFHRYARATARVEPFMTVEKTCQLLSDESDGRSKSLFNRRTIARMVLDIDHMTAYVWLAREKKKGWVEYPKLF